MFLNPIFFTFTQTNKTKSLTFDYIQKDNNLFGRIYISQTGYYSLPTANKKAILTIEQLALLHKIFSFAFFATNTDYYDAIRLNVGEVSEVAIKIDKAKTNNFLVYTIRLKFTEPIDCQNCSENDRISAFYSLARNDFLFLITQLEKDLDFINIVKANQTKELFF